MMLEHLYRFETAAPYIHLSWITSCEFGYNHPRGRWYLGFCFDIIVGRVGKVLTTD